MTDIPFDIARAASSEFKFRRVTLRYPSLMVPDTRYGVEFNSQLIVDAAAYQDLESAANAVRDKFIQDTSSYVKKPKLFNLSMDEDDDGTFVVKTKLKAEKFDGTLRKLLVVDARRIPMPEGTAIGGGSVANVNIVLWPWYTAALGYGVQFRLQAVQILDLKVFSEVTADNQFEAEEGFVASDF